MWFFQASFHSKATRCGGCLPLAPNPLPEHWKRAYSSSCSFPFKQLDVSGTAPALTQLPGERFLAKFFLAQLEDFESVPVWLFFQSGLCLRVPSKVLLLPCETSRHASSFNTDRNRLAQLTGLLWGAKLKIFREGMHPNDRKQFLPCCLSPVEV